MYKAVFQNSKAALVFAAMILFSAFSMVGTKEDSGVLVRAVDTIGAGQDAVESDAHAYAESRSTKAPKKAPGWAAEPNVFGDFTKADEAAAQQAKAAVVKPKGPPPPGSDLMTAPLASGAVVLDSGQTAVPYISESEVTITPN